MRNVRNEEKQVVRQFKSADTREKLLKAAEELFVESGFDSVSVSDIARKASVTKGHLYYYFTNKEEVFDTVLKQHLDAQRDMLAAAAAAGGGIKERIHIALDSYIDFIERNPGFPRLIQREMCSRKSASVEKISDGMAPVHAWGAGMLAAMLPGQGPSAARHFFFSIYSMTLNYYTYSGMLERLWGVDPMSESALAERRAHLHLMADLIIENVLSGKAPADNRQGAE